jgi:hypothetical protein
MLVSSRILVASMLVIIGSRIEALAESPKTAQVLTHARSLMADGALEEAIQVLESSLEDSPEDDYGVIVDQLRKAYQVAIHQTRRSGRSDLAEHYAQNLKLIDAASNAQVSGTSESPAAPPAPSFDVPPAIASAGSAAAQPPRPLPVPAESSGTVLPKATRRADLSAPRTIENAGSENADVASTPIPVDPVTPVAPPASAQPIVSRPTGDAGDTRTGGKVRQFDIAEADDAFRAKKYVEAGNLYQQLLENGDLPESRRGHLAYCRSASLVEKINKGPASPADWAAIQSEIERIQGIQPDFWFAEYLSDLVRERMNRTASNASSATTQLAATTGSGFVERTANQIKSMNPLRKVVK